MRYRKRKNEMIAERKGNNMNISEKNTCNIPNTIIVHAGKFHCDDVMCVAIMKEINPSIVIERRSAGDFLESDRVLVADVGFGKYDHHQENAKRREDGRKHAACGLVFEDYWKCLLDDSRFYKSFKKKYIIPIEDTDNGHERNPLSYFIDSLNPTWNSDTDVDVAFREAVEIIRLLIHREVEYFQSICEAKHIIRNAIRKKDQGVVVLPQYCPWQYDLCSDPDAKYVIFPSMRNQGRFNAQVIPIVPGSHEAKKSFPPSIKVGRGGCTFVHPNRFLAEFNSLAEAKMALRDSAE